MIKRLYLLLTSLIITTIVIAQESKLAFTKNHTITDGLAHNGVTSIIEDSKGYIWIGTYDGLNRYDGYGFKTYKNTHEKELIISNRVRSLCEDSNGNIWIGTDKGISIYHYSSGQFSNLRPSSKNNKLKEGAIIRHILLNKSKNLIICATEGNGVLLFTTDYQFIKQILPEPSVSNTKVLFYDGLELDSINYLYSTSDGIKILNTKEQKLRTALDIDIRYNGSIKNVRDHKVAVPLAEGVAIINYNIKDGQYSFKLRSRHLLENQFNHIEVDQYNNLWLGLAFHGALKISNLQKFLKKKSTQIEVFTDESSLLRTSCILCSEKTGCWIGTYNKGIFRFTTKSNPFKSVPTTANKKFGLKSNTVLYIEAIDKSRVLFSANRGGLAAFNTSTNNFEPLPFKVSMENLETVGSVFKDSRNDIWVSLANDVGLSRVKNNSKKLIPIHITKFPLLQQIRPRTFSEDKNGNIWVGDEAGVYKISINRLGEIYNVESLNNHIYFKDKPIELVRCVYADPQYNFVWIGTDSDGLIRINNQEGVLLQNMQIHQSLRDKNNPKSISSDFVSSIVRIPTGELWIGTEGGGICKVLKSQSEPEFLIFTEKQGLSNNVVKSIAFDKEYNLWVATNIGLNKFDTNNYQFRTFSREDGLPFEDFWYTNHKLANGYFVFSGVEGFCYFKPSDINDNHQLPKIEFEDLKIFNHSVFPGDTLQDRVLLSGRLSDVDKIELKHNENNVSFTVNSLHYSTPKNHHIKYQLMPNHEQWIEVPSDQRIISYNDLNPGEYKFKVMASNPMNQWTEPQELDIVVHPPFWKTTPAIILYLLFIGLIIYVVIAVIVRIQKLNHKLEIEHLENSKVKDVNAAKLRFFSNISHEIKTPITLISGPVNLLTKRFKGMQEVVGQLQIVERQSRKISQLIDQVHDFQRSEANLLEMYYTQFNFNLFLKDLIKDFEFLATNDKKHLQLKPSDEEIFVSGDKDKLEKIFNNLLNNAFKYTKEADIISLEINKIDRKNLEVTIQDTGRGIDKSDLPHIFERFYQSKNKHGEYTGGSGIGLAFSMRLAKMHYGNISVKSSVNKGSTFTVKLPIVINASSELQQQTEAEVISAEEKFEVTPVLQEHIDVSSIKVDESLSESIIFFVEDNTEMRQFIASVLSSFCEVQTFANGKECLVAMENDWPDMLVSDILMPELNGFELCKTIKSNLRTSHIPIVLLTACTSIEDQIKGLEFGADAYIKKPFDVQHLVSTCESLLKSRKQLRERFKIDLPLDLSKVDKQDVVNNKVFLEQFYELIEKNLDNTDIDLALFAKELYLNRTHFFQKVKAITNQTPYELIKSYRIKRAAELLVKKGLPVNDVFLMTGFKSRAHFNKLFKEKYDLPPGRYAAEIRKK